MSCLQPPLRLLAGNVLHWAPQLLRHELMKLPGRDTTAAEAEAVTADIAALQADIERADTTLEVPPCRVSSAAYTGPVYA